MKLTSFNIPIRREINYNYGFIHEDKLILLIQIQQDMLQDDLINLSIKFKSNLGCFVILKLLNEIRSKIIIGLSGVGSYVFKINNLEKLVEILDNFEFDLDEYRDDGVYELRWERNKLTTSLLRYHFNEIDENHYVLMESPYGTLDSTIELTNENILIYDPTPKFSSIRPSMNLINDFIQFLRVKYGGVEVTKQNLIDKSKIIHVQNYDSNNLEDIRKYLRHHTCPFSILTFDYTKN